jgi:G3E family GTPase
VVDSEAFLDAYECNQRISERPDLAPPADDEEEEVGVIPLGPLGGASQRAVVDLLVEQVECSDIVLLNKEVRL